MNISLYKKKDISLSPEFADQMLQNILEAGGFEPNSVPLEDLESYNNYRADKYRIRRTLLICIMVIFLLVPLLFIAPEITGVTQIGEDSPTYKVETASFLPVKSVIATINGKNIPVFENQARVYAVEPKQKGTLVVIVTAVNGQYAKKKIIVTDVDHEVPVVEDYKLENGRLTLKLADKISGVDFDTVTIIGEDGYAQNPISINESEGLVVFSYEGGDITLSVKDKAGNELKLLLTDDR